MNQSGFSLVGALAAAAIGLIVVMGTTQSFIQQRINLLALERKAAQIGVNERHQDGWQMFMGKDWSCKNTLKGKKLSGSSGDAKRSFEIKEIKDSAAAPATVWDFSKNSAGELTHSATKEKLKSLGIDKFLKLEFVYKPGPPEKSQIVLSSKTVISGLMERNNMPAVWELSGIAVTSKTAAEAQTENLPGAGDYVTSCMFTADQKVCEGGAACAFHDNPDNSKGGLVDSTATVANTAIVGRRARVYGQAQVSDSAIIKNGARVHGNAKISGNGRVQDISLVYGNAEISGHAHVGGNARVLNSAKVWGGARVWGGAVANSAQVSGKAWVFGDARVLDSAKVWDRAQVGDRTQVKGQAQLSDYAQVSDSAQVSGAAKVWGQARVSDYAQVSGSAEISEYARVSGSAQVSGTAKVADEAWVRLDAQVSGNAKISDYALISGKARVYGHAQVTGRAQVHGLAQISGNAKVYGNAMIAGNARVSGSAHVCSGAHTSGTVAHQPSCPSPTPLSIGTAPAPPSPPSSQP